MIGKAGKKGENKTQRETEKFWFLFAFPFSHSFCSRGVAQLV